MHTIDSVTKNAVKMQLTLLTRLNETHRNYLDIYFYYYSNIMTAQLVCTIKLMKGKALRKQC